MSQAIILLNPLAGGGRAKALRQPMQRWLEHFAPAVPLLAPDNVDEALATLMITATRTRVVLVGGDGTVNVLLPALLRRGHRLGVVPAGRGNDLARALGVNELKWSVALRYALHAPTAPLDLGQLEFEGGARLFASSLAVGYDAAVAQQARNAPSWLGNGRACAGWAALRAWISQHPSELKVWLDGKLEHDGPALLASVLNTPTYHNGVPAAPQALLDDGQLDTLLVDRPGRIGLLRLLPRLWTGHHLGRPGVRLLSCKKMLIDASTPLELAVDGEPITAAARFSVQVLRRALQVARPQD
ncbi:MAG: diacylglycerol kinase family protein [Leptothrix sp. (in: b-proteobacteria)]